VLFTRDPLDLEGRRMLAEASWGLGEAVVSGRVTPDRWRLDRENGSVVERHVSHKALEITKDGPRSVPVERQDAPCLDNARLTELAELGRRVEAYYGGPRDVEWAWADGRFWLLQARPITSADAFEREEVRRAEMAALAARTEPGGTVWARFNLSEILPDPTPLTWAVVRRFMSGKGGFGLMYRDLGFDPDPALDDEGIFDLVCGHPYCNLSREPRMHYRDLPFEHAFTELKADPRRALYPQPKLNRARLGWRFWLFLPVIVARIVSRMTRTLMLPEKLAGDFPRRFREEVAPTFAHEAESELARGLAEFTPRELVQRFELWTWRTLDDFARESLKPTALALIAMGNLERRLAGPLGPERAGQAVRDLIMGVRPDPEADLPGAVRDLAAGRLDRNEFLRRFGHRGSHEMELAHPRWMEDGGPASAGRTGGGSPPVEADSGWQRIAGEAKLVGGQRTAFQAEVERLHLYIGLRETAKHYLMKGYAVLRRLLVELDRRHGLNGGIFYLTPDELPRLASGEDPSTTIAARRRRRALVLSLEVPPVLFSDDLEAIGRPVPVEGGETLTGTPLSAGVAEAPALVLEEPAAEPPEGGYVLVCPSTDPAWVPLFVRAKALVMETGGILSHGAIVAREFGLPAVAGIGGLLRRVRTGQRLRVDGGRGTVTVLPD
jgi:pyruvate,water dikinase